MPNEIDLEQARTNLDELVNRVASGSGAIVIEKKGKPLAVLITPEQWEDYQQLTKDRFFQIVDEIRRRNADKDPDEVYRDVTAVVEEVRQEMYEQKQRRNPGRS